MTVEINNKIQIKKPRGQVRKSLIKYSNQDPNQPNVKRERFLALMKSRYGYTNEKAIDELKRLLKQFYRSNRSLGIRKKRPNDQNPHIE
jgi:hypothetical protein